MAETHDRKSHDYASDENPSGNYHFAGQMALLFKHSYYDAGFWGRIAEKVYRLANLESSNKTAKNETIEDTEKDICVIVALWMTDRRARRTQLHRQQAQNREFDVRDQDQVAKRSLEATQQIIRLWTMLTPNDILQLGEFINASCQTILNQRSTKSI